MNESMHDMSIDLRIFWLQFGIRGKKNWHTRKPRAKTLEALKELAERDYHFKFRTPLENRRMAFNKTKYRRHNLHTHARCFVCFKPASCRHHIIPLSSGGSNAKRNIVSLCSKCHARIHPWLKKAPVSGTDSGRKVRALDTPLAVEAACNPGPHEASNATL